MRWVYVHRKTDILIGFTSSFAITNTHTYTHAYLEWQRKRGGREKEGGLERKNEWMKRNVQRPQTFAYVQWMSHKICLNFEKDFRNDFYFHYLFSILSDMVHRLGINKGHEFNGRLSCVKDFVYATSWYDICDFLVLLPETRIKLFQYCK